MGERVFLVPVATVDGVEVSVPASQRVIVVDRFGEAVIVGGRAKRRVSQTTLATESAS